MSKWSVSDFWAYAGGLVGNWEASQLRDTMESVGLAIGPAERAVGWRWRQGCGPWAWAADEPTGPSIHLFEVQPLYAREPLQTEK